MRADVKRVGDVVVVSIEGTLEIEETQPFREACLSKLLSEKLVFNMKQATFVGSNGLQPFLDTISRLNEANEHGVKIVGVKAEFKRVITSLEAHRVTFHENINDAVKAFVIPVQGLPLVVEIIETPTVVATTLD
jgi:anti-anti-sigma factor